MKLHILIILIIAFCLSSFGQEQLSDRDKAFELYQQGDYNSVITLLQNVVQLDKNDRKAWLYLGMSLAKTGNSKEALKVLRKGDSVSSKDTSDYDKKLKIISKPRVTYSDTARQSQTRGKVTLAVEFNANGTITMIVPIQRLPDGLTENCIEAARNIKFEAAIYKCKPITTISTIDYSFEIF